MNALIFGSNGQDGFYLRNLLINQDVKVVGVSRSNADVIGNVEDINLVEHLVRQHKPDYIFHFAANSTTRHDAVRDNHNAIATGSINILEAVKKHSQDTKVFLSGSGLQFKNDGKAIDENIPFVATSPYVISRNYSVDAARYYRSLGLKVYIGYFFNHDSPRRPNRHMAQKIAYYCQNLQNECANLEIGDIKVRKEWTYAGDIVEAIWILINQEKVFECVLGSGKAYSIEDWLNICFTIVDKQWSSYVTLKSGFVSEYDLLVSDPTLIKSLGWSPKISIQALATKMINNET